MFQLFLRTLRLCIQLIPRPPIPYNYLREQPVGKGADQRGRPLEGRGRELQSQEPGRHRTSPFAFLVCVWTLEP